MFFDGNVYWDGFVKAKGGGGANGASGSESNFHPWIGLHTEYSEC